MIYLYDMQFLSKNELPKLKDSDTIILVSDTDMYPFTSTGFMQLKATKAEIRFVTCSSTMKLAYVCGQYAGANGKLEIHVANPKFNGIYDVIDLPEKVAKPAAKAKLVKKVTPALERKSEKATATEIKKEEVVQAEPKKRGRKAVTKKQTSEASAEPKRMDVPLDTPSEKKPVKRTITKNKKNVLLKILGKSYSDEQYARILDVIERATDEKIGLPMLCQLELSDINALDQEKMLEAYNTLH